MKLKMLVVAMLVVSGSAYAGTDKSTGEVCQGSTCNGGGTNGGYVVNVYEGDKTTIANSRSKSSARSNSWSNSASYSGSVSSSFANGGAGGSASSTAYGGTASGGSASVNNTVNVGGTGTSRTTRIESVGIAPDLGGMTTAPCRVAIGAGGGWIGGALSLQGAVLDEGCDTWRDVQNLASLHETEAALRRACDKPEVARALGATKCPKKEEEPKTAQGYIH